MSIIAGHSPPAGQDQGPGRPARPALWRRIIGRKTLEPGVGMAGLIPYPRLRVLGYLVGLGVVLWFSVSDLKLGLSGAGLGALICLIVASLGWVGWNAGDLRRRRWPAAMLVMVAGGGALTTFGAPGLYYVGIGAGAAALTYELPVAVALAGAGLAGFAAVAPVHKTLADGLLEVVAVAMIGLVSGASRRQIVQRTRQATLIATAARQAEVARQEAEVARREAEMAGERNRLGREMHDVLAHTLGALSIQLTALDTLVKTGASRAQLREQIENSHRLVGEGLDEARQAVRALREDTAPLADQLSRLCQQHGAHLEVTGTPRPVPAEASLALYRVAQEAMTNAAKHAPGAPVTVRLIFGDRDGEDEGVSIAVRNDVPGGAEQSRLGDSGGGYGLQGMRERIRLAGGQSHAGPAEDGGWHVTAWVPA